MPPTTARRLPSPLRKPATAGTTPPASTTAVSTARKETRSTGNGIKRRLSTAAATWALEAYLGHDSNEQIQKEDDDEDSEKNHRYGAHGQRHAAQSLKVRLLLYR